MLTYEVCAQGEDRDAKWLFFLLSYWLSLFVGIFLAVVGAFWLVQARCALALLDASSLVCTSPKNNQKHVDKTLLPVNACFATAQCHCVPGLTRRTCKKLR